MDIETQNKLYPEPVPDYLWDLYQTPMLQRICGIDMNCGVNYTSFPLFCSIAPYSRGEHSLSCARLALHFGLSPAAVISCLFHDCATPVFSHSVDFLHGDYMCQESTEERTYALICQDREVQTILNSLGLSSSDVADYHRYPLADNPSPKLSCDRLEYTLGNILNYGFADFDTVHSFLLDLVVNETQDELVFQNRDMAVSFAFLSLQCSRVYTSDPDRYAMEYTARLLRKSLQQSVFVEDDFFCLNESDAIERLVKSSLRPSWYHFTRLNMIQRTDHPQEGYYKINAKHRYIDPMVQGQGRVSQLETAYQACLQEYLNETYDYYIKGEER